MKLTVTALYPDMLGLYGDRGNLMALARVARDAGVELELRRVESFSDPLKLENTDLLCCGACETRVAIEAAEALSRRRDELSDYIENGGVVFCSGGSHAIFGEKVTRHDGDEHRMLGLVDAQYRELRAVYSNDAVFTTDRFGGELEVVGGQLQMLKVFVGSGASPLGRVVYGYGNKKETDEGVSYKNFIATNLLGPVLTKNPLFARALLALAADKKGLTLADGGDYAFEQGANDKIKAFIKMKLDSGSDKTRINNEEVMVDIYHRRR